MTVEYNVVLSLQWITVYVTIITLNILRRSLQIIKQFIQPKYKNDSKSSSAVPSSACFPL